MFSFIKKLLRDIKSSALQFLTIIIIMGVGSAFFVGLNVYLEVSESTINKYYETHNLADAELMFAKPSQMVKQSQIDEFMRNNLDILNSVYPRYTLNITNDDYTLRIHTLTEDDTTASMQDKAGINKLYIVNDSDASKNGRLPNRDNVNEIAMDNSFAISNNLHINSAFTMKIYLGDDSSQTYEYTFKIVGLVNSPEYVFAAGDPVEILKDDDLFGVIYIFKESLQALMPPALTDSFNDILFDLKDGVSTQELKSALIDSKILPEGNKDYLFMPRTDMLSYSVVDKSFAPIRIIVNIFSILFFVIASLVTFVAITRMITNKQEEILILRSLGKSNNFIISSYFVFAILISVCGSILFSILGNCFLPPVMYKSFTLRYVVPYAFETPLMPNFIALAFGMAFVVSMLSIYIAGRHTIHQFDTGAISGKKRKNKNKQKQIADKDKSFSLTKYAFVNMRSGRTRIILVTISIMASTALLYCGFGLYNSATNLVEPWGYAANYNFSAKFDEEIDNTSQIPFKPEFANMINGIYKSSHIPLTITTGFNVIATKLCVFEPNSKALDLMYIDGSPMTLQSNDIIIPQKLADYLNISAGDKISVYISSDKTKTIDLTITKISRQFLRTVIVAGQDVFGSLQYFNDNNIKVDNYFTDLAISLKEYTNFSKFKNYLETSDNLGYVSITQSPLATSSLKSYNKLLQDIVGIVLVGAAVLIIMTLFNVSLINILERRKEFATLKTLGFFQLQINLIFLLELLVTWVVSLVFGLIFGDLMYKYIIALLSTGEVIFSPIVSVGNIFIVIFAVTLFVVLSYLLILPKLKQIDMVTTLKMRE